MILIADVSNNQAHIDLAHLQRAGVRGLYHKASEGIAFVDPYFASRRAEAAALKLPFGAYHFAHPEHDPVLQAGYLCDRIGSLGRRELRPVLDLELGDPAHVEAFARAFTREVFRRLHVWPLFYSYSDYIERMALRRTIGDGLWLAAYNRNDGTDHPFTIPAPWSKTLAHQFTSTGRLAGVVLEIDLSHARSLRPLYAHPLLALAP